MTMNDDTDKQTVLDHLSAAQDELLAAMLRLGPLPMELPAQGFDRALLASQSYQVAKERARQAWRPLIEKAGDTQAAMRAEEAVNELNVRAAELGWRLAFFAGANRG